jgi:hypothetical protein
MDLNETGWEVVVWIYVAPDTDQWGGGGGVELLRTRQ